MKSATKGLKQPAATKACNRGVGGPRQHVVLSHNHTGKCISVHVSEACKGLFLVVECTFIHIGFSIFMYTLCIYMYMCISCVGSLPFALSRPICLPRHSRKCCGEMFKEGLGETRGGQDPKYKWMGHGVPDTKI